MVAIRTESPALPESGSPASFHPSASSRLWLLCEKARRQALSIKGACQDDRTRISGLCSHLQSRLLQVESLWLAETRAWASCEVQKAITCHKFYTSTSLDPRQIRRNPILTQTTHQYRRQRGLWASTCPSAEVAGRTTAA